MKYILIWLTVMFLCLLPLMLRADDPSDHSGELRIEKGNKTIIIKTDKEKLEQLKNLNNKDLEDLKNIGVNVDMGNTGDDAPDAPFVGIYPADLDFPKAQSLNYPYCYGILVSGVIPNTPAYKYRLAEDDIIMELNGRKVLNLKEFDKLKSTYRAGDAVNLTLWRNGETIKLDFVFGSKEKKELKIGPDGKLARPKLSPGYGGGGLDFMWNQFDMTDINSLLSKLGYNTLPSDGNLSIGFGGKGNVGKGYFLGGEFQFLDHARKTDVGTYTNTMNYDLFIGGATLDKRIPLAKNVIASLGFMLGGASHELTVLHTNGHYDWGFAAATTDTLTGGNTSVTISKGYIVVQPRAEVMLRLLSWLGLRGEVGYLYGYSPEKGWSVTHANEVYDLKNSPDTQLKSLTIMVGPWFGF